jgi:hypothetical protein
VVTAICTSVQPVIFEGASLSTKLLTRLREKQLKTGFGRAYLKRRLA